MLTQNEIFYNYFHSDLVKQIPIDTRGDKQPAFKSIDILKFDPNDPNFFELFPSKKNKNLPEIKLHNMSSNFPKYIAKK